MQFSVPQFIDVEDKVVGPFTAKQTVYLLGGGGIVLLSFILFNTAFFLLIAMVFVPLTLGFAFYRPKGITMARYVENFMDYLTTEHLYLWRRDPQIVMFKMVQKKHTGSEAPMKMVTRSRIRELANLLDTSASVDMRYEAETRPDEEVFA
jgi:hypothetical protein